MKQAAKRCPTPGDQADPTTAHFAELSQLQPILSTYEPPCNNSGRTECQLIANKVTSEEAIFPNLVWEEGRTAISTSDIPTHSHSHSHSRALVLSFFLSFLPSFLSFLISFFSFSFFLFLDLFRSLFYCFCFLIYLLSLFSFFYFIIFLYFCLSFFLSFRSFFFMFFPSFCLSFLS